MIATLFREEPLYAATLVLYALAFLVYVGTWFSTRRGVAQLATATVGLALASSGAFVAASAGAAVTPRMIAREPRYLRMTLLPHAVFNIKACTSEKADHFGIWLLTSTACRRNCVLLRYES